MNDHRTSEPKIIRLERERVPLNAKCSCGHSPSLLVRDIFPTATPCTKCGGTIYGKLKRVSACCPAVKASASLPPCECLILDKEPSAYHATKCPRFVEGVL